MSEEVSVDSTTVRGLSPLSKTTMLIRYDCRSYFGPSFASKWGFWVDHHLSSKIHSFGDWIDYPKGDYVMRGHTKEIWCVEITRDGRYLFTGSEDHTIIKWDMCERSKIGEFEGHKEQVRGLAHFPGILVSAAFETEIKIWNDEDFSLIRILKGHTHRANRVCLNKNGDILLSSSYDKTCRMWSVKSGECLRVMKGHTKLVQTVILAGDAIITGSTDQSIRIWNVDSGQELKKITKGIGKTVSELSLNCDSSMLACCYPSGFTVFQYPSMEIIIEKKKIYPPSVCFHPSNPTILAVSNHVGYSIKIYRTDTDEFIRTLEGHTDSISTMKFSPDGLRLISVSWDRDIIVWDVSDLK